MLRNNKAAGNTRLVFHALGDMATRGPHASRHHAPHAGAAGKPPSWPGL